MAASAHASATLARRYAKALFDLANEQGKLDAVAADLDRFEKAAKDNAALAGFLNNPVTSRAESTNAVRALLGRIRAS